MKDRAYRLLRWSERYTKTDMVYLAKNSLWFISSQTFSVGLAFLMSMIFARYIPQDVYGNYKYILTLASFLSGFSLSGLNTGITRSVARGTEGVLRDGFRISLKWGSLITMLAFGSSIYYLCHGEVGIAIGLIAIGILTPIANSSGLWGSFLNGRKLFRQSFWMGALRGIFQAIVMIAVIYMTDSFVAMVIAYLATDAFTDVLAYAYTIRRYRPNGLTDDRAITYSKHLSLMGAINNISNTIDSILTFNFLGPAMLAVYAFTIAIPDNITGLTKSIYTLTLPKFSRANHVDVLKMLRWKILLITLTAAAVSLVYVVAAPYIFTYLLPRYIGAVFYTQIYSLNIVLAAAGTFPGVFLDSQLETKRKYTISIFSSVSKIVLMSILVFPFGLVGIIAAEMAVRACTLCIYYVLIRTM